MTISPPQGFRPLRIAGPGGYIENNGPYYWRTDDGRVSYGFIADARHANPSGVVHGGAIMGFVDTVMGRYIMHKTGRRCATIALDTRFVAAAPVGSWIETHTAITQQTGSMAFIDTQATADGRLVVTVSAIFKLFPATEGLQPDA